MLTRIVSKLDRLQQDRIFKIVASVLVIAALLTYIGFGIVRSGAEIPEFTSSLPEMVQDANGEVIPNPIVARDRQLHELMVNSRSSTNVVVIASLIALFNILVIWIGLGITYLATMLFVGIVGLPLYLYGNPTWKSAGFILIGIASLMLNFAILLRALRMMLGFAHPIFTIARNVLSEAIRMKISLVFILVLAGILAVLPLLLGSDQPLRYRIQGFLHWSVTASFWFTALLVVFFSAATVSYEQRMKVIWQTMTKPVSVWEYILGKWLGVVLLSGALLTVSGLGIFQFTEYLRGQKAIGEIAPFEPRDGLMITEDRMSLETQVLTARESHIPYLPYSFADPIFNDPVEQEVERQRQMSSDYVPTRDDLLRFRKKIFDETIADYRSIDPRVEGYARFSFRDLQRARKLGNPLTLRYKVNAEGNRPDAFYALTFIFESGAIIRRPQTGLGFSHTMTIDSTFINEQGELNFDLYNGDLGQTRDGSLALNPNDATATIPPDGLEISYKVGSYRTNFARIMFVLWVKVALLAMIAIWASTFASFPVACLMSFSIFMMGESSGFVQSALPGWAMDSDSAVGLFRTGIYHFANAISSFFSIYNELRPIERISDGKVIAWSGVSKGVMIFGTGTVVFYLMSIYVFRRRQLAIYSGN